MISTRAKREARTAWVFMLPAILALLLVAVWPLTKTF